MSQRRQARRPPAVTCDFGLIHHQFAVCGLQLQGRGQRQPGVTDVTVGGAGLTNPRRRACQRPAWRFQLAVRAVKEQAIALHLQLRRVPMQTAEPRSHAASNAFDESGLMRRR